jgi:hypothetical protein
VVAVSVCKNYREFEEAVSRKENPFDPFKQRKHVEENFSSKKMAENYLNLYRRIIKGEWLNPVVPTYVSNKNPQTLLNF